MISKEEQGKLFQFNREASRDNPFRFGPFLLHQIGEVNYEQGYENTHNQWCYEISVIISGVGIFTVNENEKGYAVKENDIFINSCTGTHTIQAKDNKLRYLYLGFTFNEEATSELANRFHLFLDSVIPTCKSADSYGVGILLNRLLEEFQNDFPFKEELVVSYLEAIMVLTYRTFTMTQSKSIRYGKNGNTVGSTIYSVIKYVENNIFTITDIRSIAEELNFSYSYLSHMFRKKTGITLQRHIMFKKVEKSCELIQENKLSMTDIALMLNYESLQSFSKSFKSVMSISPTQYKNQILGE